MTDVVAKVTESTTRKWSRSVAHLASVRLTTPRRGWKWKSLCGEERLDTAFRCGPHGAADDSGRDPGSCVGARRGLTNW